MRKVKKAVSKIRAATLGTVLTIAGITGYNASVEKSQILKPAEQVAGPTKYVAYRKTLVRKPGIMSKEPEALKLMGAKNVKPLEAVDGFSFEVDGEPNLNGIKTLAGTEWMVQKELIHHILPFSCSKCETIPCPTDPSPTPTPTPNPTPNPIEADKSWGRARVHARAGLALVNTTGVKICDIDTGIDLNHPNRGNVVASISFTGESVQDGNGHGTHTAGTIAGTGGIGVSQAKLLICKGLSNSGSGSSSQLTQCLTWCGQQGAQIVSNSWGSPQSDAMINQAINALTAKGIYVFVANGNDSGPVNWPAKLAGTNSMVYAVAASDQSDQIAYFSSRGAETRYIAPGVGIPSNWPGGGLRNLDGTSMATPHAAGVCAAGVAKGLKPCIKAVSLNLPATSQGRGLPDVLETVK